ncbi:MAG: cation-translocating P-type ATPase [Planctomycetota bacterium]|jgi:Ca2+-transporting ATPase
MRVAAESWKHPAEAVLRDLDVALDQGLSQQEAARRLAREGPNQLAEFRPTSAARIFFEQLRSMVVVLLIGAAILSFVFGGPVEGVAILAVVVINTLLGFFTELRAVRSMEALRSLGRVETRVRRGGRELLVQSQVIVPGDIVALEAGDVITADVRLVESSRLHVDESTFTGESLPVAKNADAIVTGDRVDQRTNMLFRGTALTRGSCEGVVVATGMRTELGRISELAQAAAPDTTPLEKKLDVLANRLIGVTLVIAAMVAAAGILAGKSTILMIETGIALAVATIPEGLPIVATIALARGLWRMSRRNALVNRLSAVETLGSTTVICSDKTGTLTENRLHVERIALESGDVAVSHPGESGPLFSRADAPVDPQTDEALRAALEIGVLCSNAALGDAGDGSEAVGDPLEVALLVAGERAGLARPALLEQSPQVGEDAFDSITKRMATYHRTPEGTRIVVKGAPEEVIPACTLDAATREAWIERNAALAASGLRTIAAAQKLVPGDVVAPYSGLTLVGLFALVDPPRLDVSPALAACRAAGVRVIVLTGDHPATARFVATAVGLVEAERAETMHGERLAHLGDLDAAERERVRGVSIFARVDPAQKLDLIRLHQEAGAVVGMIGDGDIGIAMGKRGTQVAREAAEIVLTDDAFASIVAAVELGRVIFGNIRSFVFYLLSCNISEVMIVASAAAVDAPLPILPLQILFLNLVSDVFPALALGMGRGSTTTMERPPRDPKEGILTRRHAWGICGYGLLITVAVLVAFAQCLGPLALGTKRAVTVAFLTLAFAQLWHVFNMRERGTGVFRNEITRNPFVWGALALCTVLLLIAVYVPPLAEVLELVQPTAGEWLMVLGFSLVPLVVGQVLRR